MVGRGEAIGVVVLPEVVVAGAAVLLSFPIRKVVWILPVVVLFGVVLGVFVLRTVGVVAGDR